MTATASSRDELDAQAYATLQNHDGNATRAATELGMARTSFRAAIIRHTERMTQDAATEPETATATEDVPTAEVEAQPEPEPEVSEPEVAAMEQASQVFTGAANGKTPKPASAPKVAAGPRARRTASFKLPEGVITPVEFRHLLVSEGLADESLRTQIVYGWVKQASFPVLHYTETGASHTSPQTGDDGLVITRPGADPGLATAWYLAKFGGGGRGL